jgi:hypothetical protein
LSILAARARGSAAERGLAAASAFLSHFAAGRLAEARALTALGFRWFGRAATSESWAGYFARAPSRYQELRVVPAQSLGMIPLERHADLLDGVVGAAEVVVLADLERKGRIATVGLIVDCARAPAIQRLFDPRPLADFLLSLGP